MGLFSSSQKEDKYILTRSGNKVSRDGWHQLTSACAETFSTPNLDDVFELLAPLLMQKFDKLDKIDLIIKQNEELKQRCIALETKITNLENSRNR